jgi:hypothetical protein
MAVYVDWLINYGWKLRGYKTPSCHLTADSLDELHAFALQIGMKREWFQLGSLPHYDLTPQRRKAAVDFGAVELTKQNLREVYKRLRAVAKLAACLHSETEPGPRVPLRWGSAATELCRACAAYRTLHHNPGEWQLGPPDTERSDDV